MHAYLFHTHAQCSVLALFHVINRTQSEQLVVVAQIEHWPNPDLVNQIERKTKFNCTPQICVVDVCLLRATSFHVLIETESNSVGGVVF